MPPLVIAGGIAAGASLASNIYSTKKAGDINTRALTAQEKADADAAALEREKLAAAERARQDAIKADQARWNDYVRINSPYWAAGSAIYGNLLDVAGLGGGSAVPFTLPAAPTGGGTIAAKGTDADLQALLAQGMSPQDAAAAFNKTYGRTTGNEAVAYGPEAHGGIATIGIPEGYLAQDQPNGGWGWTPRGGSSGGSGMTAGPVAALPMVSTNLLDLSGVTAAPSTSRPVSRGRAIYGQIAQTMPTAPTSRSLGLTDLLQLARLVGPDRPGYGDAVPGLAYA